VTGRLAAVAERPGDPRRPRDGHPGGAARRLGGRARAGVAVGRGPRSQQRVMREPGRFRVPVPRTTAGAGARSLMSSLRATQSAALSPLRVRRNRGCIRAKGGAAFAQFQQTPTAGPDEVGQRDLADRRPPLSQSGCRSGDGAAVAGGHTLAVDFRDTLSRRTGRTTTTSATAGARRVVSVVRLSGPRRPAAGVAQRFPRSRRPARCCSNPGGEGPARIGFCWA
jgi:hypothetical protein